MNEAVLDSDPHDVIPSNCRDILALAEKAVERYWHQPTILNLYPMALLTSHAADWYVMRDLELKKDYKFAAEFAKAYPAWDAVRGIGNGLKHAKVEAVSVGNFYTEDMHFEHRDWWGGEAYGASFEGRMVPVDALCFSFIQEFSGDLMTGRVRDRLPLLHRAAPQDRRLAWEAGRSPFIKPA